MGVCTYVRMYVCMYVTSAQWDKHIQKMRHYVKKKKLNNLFFYARLARVGVEVTKFKFNGVRLI